MHTEVHLLKDAIAQRHKEIRQEIERNQLVSSLSQPSLGARLISALGHFLVNPGQHFEPIAKPMEQMPRKESGWKWNELG